MQGNGSRVRLTDARGRKLEGTFFAVKATRTNKETGEKVETGDVYYELRDVTEDRSDQMVMRRGVEEPTYPGDLAVQTLEAVGISLEDAEKAELI